MNSRPSHRAESETPLHEQEVEKLQRLVDKSRNEQQKSVLLAAVARLHRDQHTPNLIEQNKELVERGKKACARSREIRSRKRPA